MKTTQLTILLGLWASLLILTGCSPETHEPPARVRFLSGILPHDSTIQPVLFVDNQVVWESLDTIGSLSPRLEFAAGHHRLELVQAGDPARHRYWLQTVDWAPGLAYTCVLSGELRSDGGVDSLGSVLQLENSLSQNYGYARLRAANARIEDTTQYQLCISDSDWITYLPQVGPSQATYAATIPQGDYTLSLLQVAGPPYVPFTVTQYSDSTYTAYILGSPKYARPWLLVLADLP
jgi:hypothetical protein